MPSVYSDHVGAPTYSKASQAVSCPDTVCGTEVSGIGVPGKGSGGKQVLLKMVLLLLGQDLESLVTEHNSSAGLEGMKDTSFCKAQFGYECALGIVYRVQSSLGFLPYTSRSKVHRFLALAHATIPGG